MPEMRPSELCAYCQKPISDNVYKISSNLICSFCSERCRTIYYFLKGHCLEFAIALHRTYGYPIKAIFSRDTNRTLIHAFCVSPSDDSITIDGRGVSSISKIMLDYPDFTIDDIKSVTEDNLIAEFPRDAKYTHEDYNKIICKAINCIKYTTEANIGITYELPQS